jgi:hypothetical protein
MSTGPWQKRTGDCPWCSPAGMAKTPRSLTVLTDLAHNGPLSPTQFSLSVHNAIIGLWSIQRGVHSEMTAIVGAGDALENAVLEACGMRHNGAMAALLVIAEQTPPELNYPFIDDVPFPYAVGLLLTAGDDRQLHLRRTNGPRSEWPHAINLVRALCGDQQPCNTTGRADNGPGQATRP